mgnify:CR=1 FL=1
MNKNKYKMAGPLRYMGGGHFKNKYVTGGMYGPNVIPGAMIPGTASTVYSESTAPQQQNINRQIANLNQGAWQDDFMKEQAASQALGSTALSAGTSALTTALPKLINMSPKDLTYSQNVTRGWMKGARGDYDTLARAGAPKTTMGRTLENPGFGTGVGTAMDVAGQIGQQAWSDDDPTTFTGKEKFARMGSAAGKGMKMGAQLGSIIPGVGTAIGAAAGTTIGAWSGLLKGKKEQREAQEELAKRNMQKAGMMNRAAQLASQDKEYSGYDFGVQRRGGLRRKYDHGGTHLNIPEEASFPWDIARGYQDEYIPLSQRVPTDVHPFNVPRWMREQAYPQGLPHPHIPGGFHTAYTPQTQMDLAEQRRAEYIPQTQRRNGGHRYHAGGHRHPHTGDPAAQDTVMSYIYNHPEFKKHEHRLDSKYYKKIKPRLKDALRNLENYSPTKEEFERNAKLLNLINSKGDPNIDKFIGMFDHYKEDRPLKKKDLKWAHQGVLDWYLRDGGLRRKYDGGGIFSGVEPTPPTPSPGVFQEPSPHTPGDRSKFEGNPWEINRRLWMESLPHINNRLRERLNPFGTMLPWGRWTDEFNLGRSTPLDFDDDGFWEEWRGKSEQERMEEIRNMGQKRGGGLRSMYRRGGLRRKYDGGGIVSGINAGQPGHDMYGFPLDDDGTANDYGTSGIVNALFGTPEDAAETTLDTWGMFYPPASWGSGVKDFGKAGSHFDKGQIFSGIQDLASGLLSFIPYGGPATKNVLKSVKGTTKFDKAVDKVNTANELLIAENAQQNLDQLAIEPGFGYQREVPADYFTADYFKAGKNPFKYDTPKYWEWQKAKRQHSLYGKK